MAFKIRKTNTNKMLEYMYHAGRPVTVKEICEDTGLIPREVYFVSTFLSKMKKITRTHIVGKAKLDVPPVIMVSYSLTEIQRENAKRVMDKYKMMKKISEQNGI